MSDKNIVVHGKNGVDTDDSIAYNYDTEAQHVANIGSLSQPYEVDSFGTNSDSSTDINRANISDVYKVATKSVSKILDRVSHKIKNAKEALNVATVQAKDSTNEYLINRKLENERSLRREAGKVAIVDSLLNIRGTFSTLQTVEKKWYLAVYPKANLSAEYDEVNESWIDNIDHDDVHHTLLEELPKDGVPNNFSEYENIVNWRKTSETPVTGRKSEYSRSVCMYPFSTESFLDLSFYIHLIDLSRYKSIEFCIFIEGPHDAEPLLPKSVVLDSEYGLPLSRTDLGYIPQVADKKRSIQKIMASYMKKNKFIPGFYAEMSLRRGAVFSPCGGRLHLVLKPNAPMLLNLQDGHKLAAIEGLDVLITLMPIAQPSTLYLRTFRNYDKPAQCYPSNLIDCVSLTNVRVQWDQLNTGRATCCGQFKNKIFVGSLNRGPKKTECVLYEFNKFGKRVGKVLIRDGNERVVMMFSGHYHITCCFNNGMIAIIREKSIEDKLLESTTMAATTNSTTTNTNSSDFIDDNNNSNNDNNHNENSNRHTEKVYDWHEPLYLSTHPEGSKIVSGCMMYHANMDILFLVDNTKGISVHILDRGLSIRTAYNPSFLSNEIKQLCCFGQRLYLAQSDGAITVINLMLILNGELEYINQLSRLIVSHETIINTGGISCMTLFSANSFLGLRNEDDVKNKQEMDNNVTFKVINSKTDNLKYDFVEGHMLLVGGGDDDPSIRLLKPGLDGMREIVCLKGHSKAVTDIFADAAGRFFITSSKGDKSILIWDGLSFRCERQITDVSIGCITIADNLIIVSSITNPFIRFWGIAAPLIKQTQKQKQLLKKEYDEDDNPEYIKTIRNSYFCQAMLKANIIAPNAALMDITSTDMDPDYEKVLWRWNRQYTRSDCLKSKNIHIPPSSLPSSPNHRRGSTSYSSSSGASGVAQPPGSPCASPKKLSETPRAKARRENAKFQFMNGQQDALSSTFGDNSSNSSNVNLLPFISNSQSNNSYSNTNNNSGNNKSIFEQHKSSVLEPMTEEVIEEDDEEDNETYDDDDDDDTSDTEVPSTSQSIQNHHHRHSTTTTTRPEVNSSRNNVDNKNSSNNSKSSSNHNKTKDHSHSIHSKSNVKKNYHSKATKTVVPRHVSNQISNRNNRAHFSDSDDDDEEEQEEDEEVKDDPTYRNSNSNTNAIAYMKITTATNNNDDNNMGKNHINELSIANAILKYDTTNNTTTTTTNNNNIQSVPSSYLPPIYPIRDIYDEKGSN